MPCKAKYDDSTSDHFSKRLNININCIHSSQGYGYWIYLIILKQIKRNQTVFSIFRLFFDQKDLVLDSIICQYYSPVYDISYDTRFCLTKLE